MIEFGYIFAAQFVLVSAKAFQQQNVTHERWWQIPPTSYLLYGLELMSWFYSFGVWFEHKTAWVAIGVWLCGATGSWMGTFAGMKLHKKLRRGRTVEFPIGK